MGACGGIDTLFQVDTYQALCHIPRTTPSDRITGPTSPLGGVSFFAPMIEFAGGLCAAGMDSGFRRNEGVDTNWSIG